ncbi:MAG: hypothetical protein QM578_00070 [Pantoea sp.]|uniref:hypothetical protein n=1 Tax=Pantoea sp. TaxID=69393 RepID=UPI0039E4131F
MHGSGLQEKVYLPALIMWGLVYLGLGYISLLLDDPQSRVAMVWFAAGGAISACLSLPRRIWPLLFVMLFVVRSGLDAMMRHSPVTSMVLSLISLSGDFTVAWCAQHFSRGRDDFRKISAWIISTLLISAVAAAAGSGWLSRYHAIPFFDTATLWWAANVSGTLVATTVLTGLTWEPVRPGARPVIITFSGVVLVVMSAAFVFSLPPADEASAGLVYGLACVPVLLTVMVPLLAGSFAGTLAFLALSITVISLSWLKAGPFFIHGLFRGEPLLLAQCYLSGTAVLMIFIRLQQRLFSARNVMKNEGCEAAYRLNEATGELSWDLPPGAALNAIVSHLPDRDALLGCVHPRTRLLLLSRWKAIASGERVSASLVFRGTLPDGSRFSVSERHLFRLHTDAGTVIAGEWTPVHGPLPFSRAEDC